MKQVLWNIDAMGWFEPIEHMAQYGKLFAWSGNNAVRPNLKFAIDSFANMGFEVFAVSSKNENYLNACVKEAGIEQKVKLAANLPELDLMTDYSKVLDIAGQEALVIGERVGNQPMNPGAIFIHDHKPFKKDAMIDCMAAKKLCEIGNDNLILGYNQLFFSNINKNPMFAGEDIFIDGIDFYGLKLELGLRKNGCHTISTILVDENVSTK